MDIMNVLCTGMNMSISRIHIWLCNILPPVVSGAETYPFPLVSNLRRRFRNSGFFVVIFYYHECFSLAIWRLSNLLIYLFIYLFDINFLWAVQLRYISKTWVYIYIYMNECFLAVFCGNPKYYKFFSFKYFKNTFRCHWPIFKRYMKLIVMGLAYRINVHWFKVLSSQELSTLVIDEKTF